MAGDFREPREDLVLQLLQADWNKSNTFGQTPKITFGWFNEDAGNAQVTVAQPEESPIDAGDTGYSHISADGNPGQTIGGTIQVHVWSRKEDLSGASTDNPRQYNERCCEEIKRIAGANAVSPTNPDTGNQPVDSLAYDGRVPVPEPDRPSVFHYRATVRYGYDD